MRLRNLAAAALMGAVPFGTAQADQRIDACVFDIIGSSGDQYQLMEDFAIELRDIGLRLNLSAYTDESVALADFSAGECDMLVATDLRTRRFNRFAGTVSAVGALPSYEHLETVLRVMTSENAADRMSTDDYEVMGIFPYGAAFLFVTDEFLSEIDGTPDVTDLAGRTIATLEYQEDAIHMVNYVNASLDPSDITNFGGKFNNRSVDAAYSPAFGYDALELYRGIGDEGGIIDYPLAQLTGQVIVRKGVVDAETAQKAREISFRMFDDAVGMAQEFEDSIPDDHWVTIPDEDIEDYQEMFRQNRIQLRDGVDSDGNESATVYNGETLTLMRRVRCRMDPSASECTADDRE